MSIEQQLLNLKEGIEDAKEDKAQAEGRLQNLQERLAEEFDCNSTAKAEKILNRLESSIDKLKTKLSDGLADLEEQVA